MDRTLPIAGVMRTWLVHMWEGPPKAPEKCFGRFSEHHVVAKKPYGPTVRFSCDVTCHLVWALKFRPRRHFVRLQLHEAAHSFLPHLELPWHVETV